LELILPTYLYLTFAASTVGKSTDLVITEECPTGILY